MNNLSQAVVNMQKEIARLERRHKAVQLIQADGTTFPPEQQRTIADEKDKLRKLKNQLDLMRKVHQAETTEVLPRASISVLTKEHR